MRSARSVGFTLVELLLSVAIAVLLAALAWSLLSTTTRSVASQQERSAGPAAAARVAERIQADLVSLFLPADDEACALALSPSPFSLSFCAMTVAGRTPDLVWSDPRRIEYAVDASRADDMTLMRVEERLSGPIGRATNRLASRVAQVSLELYDGESWQPAWPPEGATHARPRAARLAVRKEGMSTPVSVEFWIPVGQAFTSRIVRTGMAQ